MDKVHTLHRLRTNFTFFLLKINRDNVTGGSNLMKTLRKNQTLGGSTNPMKTCKIVVVVLVVVVPFSALSRLPLVCLLSSASRPSSLCPPCALPCALLLTDFFLYRLRTLYVFAYDASEKAGKSNFRNALRERQYINKYFEKFITCTNSFFISACKSSSGTSAASS